MKTLALAVFLPLVMPAAAHGAPAAAAPLTLSVDAREAPRRILHARLRVPAAPGPLTLRYPKWIPGEHGPEGPINELAGLRISVGGKAVAWARDPVDLYSFHVAVPPGASGLDVAYDYLLPVGTGDGGHGEGASATDKLLALEWNLVTLYPEGRPASEILVQASLRLPAGWKHGTELPIAREAEGTIEFAPVSLERLVDSPVLAGVYFRSVPLGNARGAPHRLDIAADSAEALELTPETEAALRRLVAEATTLFGARHYRAYRFLLTLSEHTSHFGLEHHESSDNRVRERSLIDADLRRLTAGLLPHEMTHSWIGKYRRPAGLATSDFQQPMKTELLWVYEGLTSYVGNLLTARSGLSTVAEARERWAFDAAFQDHRAGRSWRSLLDTAVAAPSLGHAPDEWTSWRRTRDYYPESALIWLEIDTLLRRESKGAHSLDDLCRGFFGGSDGDPTVVPYTYEDLVRALGEIGGRDWRAFLDGRLSATDAHAPLAGLEASGWRLIYNAEPNLLQRANEQNKKIIDEVFSLGLRLKDDGTVVDVVPGLPAANAGVGPGMKLWAIDGRHFSAERLRSAVQATGQKGGPSRIELLVENTDYFHTFSLAYKGGARYPHLERDASHPDLLGEILKPRVATAVAAGGTSK